MEPVRFDAPWDPGLRRATAFGLAIVCGAGALVAWMALDLRATGPNPVLAFVPLVFFSIPVLLLWAAWQEAPRGFSVGNDAVRVERRCGPVVIPLATIQEVRPLDPGVSLRRVGGSGGFFGWFGTYRSAELGSVRLHATRSDGRVLIATDHGPVVVTPASPERFLDEVRRRIPARPAGKTETS